MKTVIRLLVAIFIISAIQNVSLGSPDFTESKNSLIGEVHRKISDDSLKSESKNKNKETAAKEKKEKEEKEAEEASVNFMSSWKFYFIMLIFPVILILIFIMVGRGKKG